jgi:hypothetical protein
MSVTGKGFYIWQISRIAGGNPATIAGFAQAAGIDHVIIKVADGKYTYGISKGVDLVPGLVGQMRARGIKVWGWQYVYGASPKAEADKAVARVKQLNLDGFVVDAEGQFKADGMAIQAEKYMKQLRAGLPNHVIALSSYRYPSVHKAFPFTTFLKYCDIAMPQVYWQGSSNSAEQLVKSYNEYKNLNPSRPYIPTGSAYSYGDWTATPAQVTAFLGKAKELGLKGANFWEFQTARDNGGGLWNAIQNFDWKTGGTTTPPVNDTGFTKEDQVYQAYIEALNQGDATAVASLFDGDYGKLVIGNQLLNSNTAIKDWYQAFFQNTLVGASFTLNSNSNMGDMNRLVWNAITKDGKKFTGQDFLAVRWREGYYNIKMSFPHYWNN